MKNLIILLPIIVCSCSKKQEQKPQLSDFEKIPYSRSYNYADSVAKKLDPNKAYQYWQYATFRGNDDSRAKYTILSEGGDTLLRSKIERGNISTKNALFAEGHHEFRCNYALYIENNKVNYVKTEEEFRTFLGTIDNLEEAMLLARTYNYQLDTDYDKASQYRKTEDGFDLRLMKWNEYPVSLEAIEINIKKDGFIKTKSLGIYCEDPKCF